MDVHELTEMSEDGFERMIQEMTAKVQQMKVQADAAAHNLQSSSMSQMCDAIQRFCKEAGIRCWMVDSDPVSTVDSDSMDSDSEESEADCTADHAGDPAEEVKEAQRKKRQEMREARALAANKRCPVTQHVEAVQKERTEQVAAWARQGAEHREAVIQYAQGTVCRDYDLNEGTESYVLPMTESEAICVETKERLRRIITEVFEQGGSLMTCLTAAAELAAKAGRAVRACEVDLGAVFNAADATGLAEHMTLLMGTVEEESKEAGTMAEILRVAAELESYKALSRAARNKTTELVNQATEKHAEEGGCSQCTDGGPELHTCVAQEIESGETRRSQDTTLLQHAIDVKSLKSGLGTECKGIWTGAGTECQDGSCPSLKDDATETATLLSTSRESSNFKQAVDKAQDMSCTYRHGGTTPRVPVSSQ